VVSHSDDFRRARVDSDLRQAGLIGQDHDVTVLLQEGNVTGEIFFARRLYPTRNQSR